MTRTLSVRNRQRTRVVDTRLLRRVGLWALEEQFSLPEFELGLHLVGAAEMTRLNETFLRHQGSTDVITFDHRENVPRATVDVRPAWHGEIFVCLDEAVKQARAFRSSWQSEVVRYLLHGLLHLRGFDDYSPETRRQMKREENRLLRLAAQEFSFRRLGRSG